MPIPEVDNHRNRNPIPNQDRRLADHRTPSSPIESTSSIWTTRFKIAALIDHYIERELLHRRHSTQQSHSSTLKRWTLPRWGDGPLEDVRSVEVEEWLRSLTLAPKTKVNLRSLFHLAYEHARRWELTDRNPIDLVRQRGGRRCIPRVLTPGEIRLLLAQLAEPYHTMVLVAACLGLRASEIVGLQWQDFNWEDLTVLIRRGVVNGRSGDTKTEASQKSLPIDPRLARSLQELLKRSTNAVCGSCVGSMPDFSAKSWTCFRTVCGLMPSSSPIWLLLSPRPM